MGIPCDARLAKIKLGGHARAEDGEVIRPAHATLAGAFAVLFRLSFCVPCETETS